MPLTKEQQLALEETFKKIKKGTSSLFEQVAKEGVIGKGGETLIKPTAMPSTSNGSSLQDAVLGSNLGDAGQMIKPNGSEAGGDLAGRLTTAITGAQGAPTLTEQKKTLEEEKGVPGMRETVGSFEDEIAKTQTLLDSLEEDITQRTREYLVSEPQRKRVLASEQEPLIKQLGILERGYGTATSRLERTEADILTELGLAEKERETATGKLKNVSGVGLVSVKSNGTYDVVVPEGTMPETLTYKQKVDLEVKLGNYFEKYASEAREGSSQITRMQQSYNQAVANMNAGQSINAASQGVLVTFQKLLDPTSVVRESEYARSSEGTSLLERIQGLYTQIVQGGAGLTATSLKEFIDLGKQFYAGYQSQMLNYAQRTQTQAESYGLNLENILTPDILAILGESSGTTTDQEIEDFLDSLGL